jgi:glycosyl-4,4'-diaponeurosporenoate acyltransferase
VALDVVVWLAAGVVVGRYQARKPIEALETPGPLTRLTKWEMAGSPFRRWVKVDAWKDRLPDAGTWFGGLSKKRLPGSDVGGWRRFAAESLRAERTHWAMFAVLPIFLLWNPAWLLVANVTFATVANVPCMIIARHNRARVMRLMQRRRRLA